MKKCYVYIIKSGDKVNAPFKVGVADDPNSRIKILQVGNPDHLYLVMHIECDSRDKAFKLENKLHRMLQGRHILGEWFEAKQNHILKALNAYSNNEEFEEVFKGVSTKESEKAKNKKLKIRIKSQTKHIKETESSLVTRRTESRIMREALVGYGMSQSSINEMIGRK